MDVLFDHAHDQQIDIVDIVMALGVGAISQFELGGHRLVATGHVEVAGVFGHVQRFAHLVATAEAEIIAAGNVEHFEVEFQTRNTKQLLADTVLHLTVDLLSMLGSQAAQ